MSMNLFRVFCQYIYLQFFSVCFFSSVFPFLEYNLILLSCLSWLLLSLFPSRLTGLSSKQTSRIRAVGRLQHLIGKLPRIFGLFNYHDRRRETTENLEGLSYRNSTCHFHFHFIGKNEPQSPTYQQGEGKVEGADRMVGDHEDLCHMPHAESDGAKLCIYLS